MFVCLNDRPLTLPNFLNSKKPFKSNKYGNEYKSPYVRPSSYSPNSHDGSRYSSGPFPSLNPAVNGHDFTPLRGNSGSDSAGYSYSTGLSNQNFDDYHDGPGPKSFVSVSTNLDNGGPEGVLNINHGYGYDYSSDDQTPHRQSLASYDVRSPDQYESTDPLHSLHNYHSTTHEDEDLYGKLKQEYDTRGGEKSSPYFPNYGDYQESLPTSIQPSKQYSDERNDKAQRKKAYWSMSYVQNI